MLDQTFSAQNFRRIYDIENRRGKNVDRAFFPDLVEASARITTASANLRATRRAHGHVSEDALEAILAPLREHLKAQREARDILVDATMDTVAQEVFDGYQIQLAEASGPEGMTLHTLPDDPRAYFIGKQLQRNISKLYKLRAGNRRAIISQLFDVLNTSFNLHVVRTDITSFYESIDRRQLLKELDTDQLLSFGSKKYIKQALASYGAMAATQIGIPRGLGISAFLSELYMRSIDEHIKQMTGVTFYARYVDDIIIVFSPTANDDTGSYITDITEIVAAKALALNANKTEFGATGANHTLNFDYLGYRFSIAGGKCKISVGQKKYLRYRGRIDRTFSEYERQAIFDQKGAARLLAARVKFLTGNTRLVNNKRHAYTGIYFNNSHITELGRLINLDAYLKHRISNLQSAALQDRLDPFSFQLGFSERRFTPYGTRELAEIVKAWRYEA